MSPFIIVLINTRRKAAFADNVIKKLCPHLSHDVVPSNISLFTSGKTISFEKNSPFVNVFNRVALTTREFGLDLGAASRVYEDRCMRREENWFNYNWESPKKFSDISGFWILMLYFIGIFIASIILIEEILRKRNGINTIKQLFQCHL